MITIKNLNIQHGDKHLFKNVSCQLYEHDRIGLVGVNGAGKSTLLKILAGVTECESGEISRSKQSSVGYLPQEISEIDTSNSLYDDAKTAFSELINKQKQLENVHRHLQEGGLFVCTYKLNFNNDMLYETAYILDKAGFKDIEYHHIFKDEQAVIKGITSRR